MAYFTSASLYSFYGKISLEFFSLLQLPDYHTLISTHFVTAFSEEILFRGMVLYGLVRVWGSSKKGIFGSVFLTSLLFAVVHITQVFTHGVNLSSALILILETLIISFWWGALVLLSKSIWPAVILHFVVNTAVAAQGLLTPVITPEIFAYGRVLLFSIPLGIIGIWLLTRVTPKPYVPDVH
jgi:membrane protease YdiL (CAAX protease family)